MTIKTILPEKGKGYSLEKWLVKRDDINRRFLENIGTPDFPRNTHAIEIIETIDYGSYISHKLRYLVGEDDEIQAYLLVPNPIQKPAAAILAMHQMNYFGKD